MGKRGVKQLSVFELVVIISLGSAAGDPMFYKDVGIIPALLVFLIIVALYSLITWFIGKNKRFEKLMEGKAVRLIKNGAFSIEDFSKGVNRRRRVFCRTAHAECSQLGQIEEAFVRVQIISVFSITPIILIL